MAWWDGPLKQLKYSSFLLLYITSFPFGGSHPLNVLKKSNRWRGGGGGGGGGGDGKFNCLEMGGGGGVALGTI